MTLPIAQRDRAADYGQSFEGARRLKPHLWNVDYCLLTGLRTEIEKFSRTYATERSTVVDYGCGAKPYRPLFPKACRYIGVDVCENPWADIVTEVGRYLPIPDALADLVVSVQVVYLVRDFDFYLRECRRLLKPDGRLFLTTHGLWTHHPASGGDYYRFTQDGVRHILKSSGFRCLTLTPIVGTLAAGLHLRQLVYNAWLRRLGLGKLGASLNVMVNLRILLEHWLSPPGTNMSAPVIFACVAEPDAAGQCRPCDRERAS